MTAPSPVDWPALRRAAVTAAGRAYAPYSGLGVGAAGLVDQGADDGSRDGTVLVGCNVESASYGLTLCAECGLISALYAAGGGRLRAISVAAGHGVVLPPCGRCRQLLYEHGGAECLVDAEPAPRRLGDLLPQPFGPDALEQL